MRDKVLEELRSVRRGDLVEVKFIDACRFNDLPRGRIEENSVYATYKRAVGHYYGTLLDMTYAEPYFIIILEETDGKIDIMSIPQRNIQKVTRFVRGRMLKHISDVGAPMLAGGVHGKFKQEKKGVGENVEGEKEEDW